MRIVVQRVKEAAVSVNGARKASIDKGFLLLVGMHSKDTPGIADAMARKIARLRIFEDEQGKMNLDLKDAGGAILSIPQFTLLANTKKGNRPGFDQAASPEKANDLWKKFNELLKSENIAVHEGEFGAHMEVTLTNDGPVTLVLDSSDMIDNKE